MAKKKTIEIDITLGGTISLKTDGFVGQSCMDADEALKGLAKISTEHTAEFFKKVKPNEVVVTKGS